MLVMRPEIPNAAAETRYPEFGTREPASCAHCGNAGINPAARLTRAGRSNTVAAFTLIELVVVIGIIILLIAIAVPAIGPALASNQRTQVLAALNSSLTSAQTSALSHTTDVALRVERATELDNYGRMVRPDGKNAKFLDHQRIRFVMLAKYAGLSQPAFKYIEDSKITDLPNSMWLAPTNFYTKDGDNTNDFGPDNYCIPGSTAFSFLNDPDNNGVSPYSPFDTFYIVLSPNGMLKSFNREDLYYIDDTQLREGKTTPPTFSHPQDSASGVLLYERKKLENAPGSVEGLFDFLGTNGQALYINRFLGTVVESN